MPTVGRSFQQQEITQLIRLYERAEAELQGILANAASTGFQQARARELLGQVDATIADLRRATAAWSDRTIPRAYRAGMTYAAGTIGEPVPEIGLIHRQAVGAIAGELASQVNDTALQSVAPFVGSVFRRTQQTLVSHEQLMGELGVGAVRGLSVRDLQKRIAQTLQDGASERLKGPVPDDLRSDLEAAAAGRFVAITGKDGVLRRYNLADYAETVARTATREAASEGVLQTSKELGNDLVQVSVHAGACELCAPIQGKVFSISGDDPDFPDLTDDETPPLHPNCEHVLIPVVKDFLEMRGQLPGLSAFSRDPKAIVGNVPQYQQMLQDTKTMPPGKRVQVPPKPAAPSTVTSREEAQALYASRQDDLFGVWQKSAALRGLEQDIQTLKQVSTAVGLSKERTLSKGQAAAYFDPTGKSDAETIKLTGGTGPATVFAARTADFMERLARPDLMRADVEAVGPSGETGGKFGRVSWFSTWLQNHYGSTYETATDPQLRAAYFAWVDNGAPFGMAGVKGWMDDAKGFSKIIAHEQTHAIEQQGNDWRSYGITNGGFYQEAATEAWARLHWQDAAVEVLGVDRATLSKEPIVDGTYATEVNALTRIIKEVLGAKSPRAFNAALARIKFGPTIIERPGMIATMIQERYGLGYTERREVWTLLTEFVDLVYRHETESPEVVAQLVKDIGRVPDRILEYLKAHEKEPLPPIDPRFKADDELTPPPPVAIAAFIAAYRTPPDAEAIRALLRKRLTHEEQQTVLGYGEVATMRAAVLGLPGRSPRPKFAGSKVSKVFAGYVPARLYRGERPCDRCSMFVEPAGCTYVEGRIETKATCRFWEAK